LHVEGIGIRDLVFARDGKMLAHTFSDWEKRRILIWNVATGRRTRRIDSPTGNFEALAFSPDGKLLAALHDPDDRPGQDDPWSIQIYDSDTFEVRQTIVPFRIKSNLRLVGFLPDSTTLGIMSKFGPEVQFWDVPSGKRIHEFRVRSANIVVSAVSRDGKTLAIGFRSAERGFRGAFQIGQGSLSWALGFTRDEREIRGAIPIGQGSLSWALGYSSGKSEIRLMDLTTGHEIRRIEVEGELERLAFAPEGTMLASWGRAQASGDEDRDPTTEHGYRTIGIELWDVATGRQIHRLRIQPRLSPVWSAPRAEGRLWTARNDEITSLSFGPDGRALASTGGENRIRLWDVGEGKELFPDTQHPRITGPVVFTRDSQTVITGSVTGELIFWDARSGAERRRIAAHRTAVMGLAMSADGRELVSQGQNGPTKFWDIATGQTTRELALPRDPGENAIDVSPDGRMILVGGPPHRLVDLKGGRERAQLPRDAEDNATRPTGAKFVPGHHTLIASYGKYLLECNVLTGRQLRRIEKPWVTDHAIDVSLTVSPDGSRLATGDHDEKVRLVDRNTGQEVARFAAPDEYDILAIAYSPDGRLLVAGGSNSMWLWEVASGRLLRKCENAHRGKIRGLIFSPDGLLLASSSPDATVLIWDVAELLHGQGALPQPVAAELDQLWTDLASEDASRAYRAVLALADDPSRAVPLLASRLRPVERPDAEKLARWITELGSDQDAIRSGALSALEELDDLAAPALRKCLETGPEPAIRQGIETLLGAAAGFVKSPEGLRRLRSVAVLERIGTAEARRVLERIAANSAEERQARDAGAALDRLKKAISR
jgi:WD40 repeat protein